MRIPASFVGEGPGEQEDLKGEPFVGAGNFGYHAELIYLDRSKIYQPISSSAGRLKIETRDPRRGGVRKVAEEQIRLIDRKLLSAWAESQLATLWVMILKSARSRKMLRHCRQKVMALYHPAALLRDPRRRPETFSDLKVLESEIKKICERM